MNRHRGLKIGFSPRLVYACFTGVVLILLLSGCAPKGGRMEESDLNVDERIRRIEAGTSAKEQSPEGDKPPSPMTPEAAAGPLPDSSRPDIKVMYQDGRNLLVAGQYRQAAGVFAQILEAAPRDTLAPNARYWLGECHYALGQFPEAVVEFHQVTEDYPRSAKAPDAMLKLAYSFSKLGDGNAAMLALHNLLKHYPESNAAEMVRSGRTVFPRP